MNKADGWDIDLVSALADGELRGEDFQRALALLENSDEAKSQWLSYHVLGDVLRCPDILVSDDSQAFAARVCSRLDSADDATPSVEVLHGHRDAGIAGVAAGANDPSWRWKRLAGYAALVALGAAGWQLAQDPVASGQLARSEDAITAAAVPTAPTPPGNASAQPQVMVRDARLDELMAAHKQYGGATALQAPSGFLRNATFESQGRR